MAALLRLLATAVGILPWRALPPVGAMLGWIAGTVLRLRRTHVEQAMTAAGIAGCRGQARAMYRSLGTSALEFLHMTSRGEDSMEHVCIECASRGPWDEALARGRGVVIAASHTGNWDLAACALAREVELLVVTKRLRAVGIDSFWQSARSARGVAIAEPEGAIARARAVLARGGAVAMMIDQVPMSLRHAVVSEFLGRTAYVDRSPAIVAAACRAPLVVAASRREDSGEHVLAVLDVLEPPPRASTAWARQATLTATLALERFVRAHPSQWLWLHRRWKPLDRAAGPTTLAGSCRPRSTRSSSPVAPSRAA